MRQAAAELGCPATAFIRPTERAGADFGLAWYTPTGAELTFCGHGTVAAAHALHEGGRLPRGRAVFDTLGGLPTVSREEELFWLAPALRTWAPYREPLAPVLEALGLPADGVAAWAPVALTSERDLLLPVTGLGALKALAPDLGRLAALARAADLRGVALVSRETLEPDAVTHSRFFAPHLGIPEDPTTGSLHAVLPVWLWDAGALQAEAGTVRFRAEQGDFLGRPGRLTVELELDGGRPARVRVGGEAVTVLAGTLRLP
jgi:PhzF family phenazine biosynthesis protein